MSKHRSLVLLGCLAAMTVIGYVLADQKTTDSPTAPVTAGGKELKEGEKDRAADRAAIEKSSQAFSAACAKHDAKACAAFWTEEGEHLSEEGGTIRGRKAIEEAFAKFFKENPKCKIAAHIDSIRFISKNNAIETGILRMDPGGKDLPTSTKYSVLHVKENGEWKIAFAREWAAEEDRIEDLDWLIGKWSAKNGDREVQFDFSWTPKKTFIHGKYEIKEKGETTLSGVRIIGRDPALGQLRSWTFEHGGGFGESIWHRDEDHWVLESNGTLPDGTDTYALNIIKRIDGDSFTWNSTERYVGDEVQADTEPVKVKRMK